MNYECFDYYYCFYIMLTHFILVSRLLFCFGGFWGEGIIVVTGGFWGFFVLFF